MRHRRVVGTRVSFFAEEGDDQQGRTKHYDKQRRFDCTPIGELMLNFDCRDEVVPVLARLQHVYSCNSLRNKVVKLVAEDLNEDSRRDVGRPGLDD